MSVNVYTSTGNFRFFSNPKEKAGIGYWTEDLGVIGITL
jgi:hypothetical protein